MTTGNTTDTDSAATDRVRVGLADRSYDIVIGTRLLDTLGEALRDTVRGQQVLIVQDAAVASPWGKLVYKASVAGGFDTMIFDVPTGEKSKCTEVLAQLWDVMAEGEFSRDAAVIAVGGGVVGDLAGFAAASYLRGIDFVQVPTTLLAMVDSSVGGKTGINLPQGKNLVGAFWQPSLVVADLDCLATLPEEERNSGLAEVIKYGVIHDAELFAFLEEHITELFEPGRAELLRHVIRRSVEIKAEVVGADEREGGLRRILNFGHTLGHAVEAEGNYGRLRHGECVAIGMVAASRLTLARGGAEGWRQAEHDRLEALIKKAHLPTRIPADMEADRLIDRTRVDKKAEQGKARYILPTRMGHVETVRDVGESMVRDVLLELGAK